MFDEETRKRKIVENYRKRFENRYYVRSIERLAGAYHATDWNNQSSREAYYRKADVVAAYYDQGINTVMQDAQQYPALDVRG